MVKVIKHNIPAKPHPPHYMMHRYWGRKPHNVISEYIKNFTKVGDVVLDPFMGSGIVVIESAKLNRQAIGIDLNPLSCFITENTLSKTDLNKFEKSFLKIYEKNMEEYQWLYKTKCDSCQSIGSFENSVWNEKEISRIRGICSKCGPFKKTADSFDKNLLLKAKKTLSKSNIKYPKDQILDYVKRSNKTHIDQLFTDRALIILGSIRHDILLIKDKKIRNLLLLCFSSMLPNISKMIPGDDKTVNGKSGWVVSKLWAPKIHTEKNIFRSFEARFKKIKKGKMETEYLIKNNNYSLINKNSEYLKEIEDESVDYIFTDPPYGESIAYFGLSMFFNSWLGLNVDYKNEIIFDPYRNKKYKDYHARLDRVFKELFRILKFGSYISFSFHNRNLKIWQSVIEAVSNAGFELKNIVYQEQAVQSGTQGLNRKNTLRGDFIYNYIKPRNIKKKIIKKNLNIEKTILNEVSKLMEMNNNFLTPDKLYEKIIPFIIKKNIYVDSNNKPIDIEKIMVNEYIYGKSNSHKIIYGWKKNK